MYDKKKNIVSLWNAESLQQFVSSKCWKLQELKNVTSVFLEIDIHIKTYRYKFIYDCAVWAKFIASLSSLLV